MKANGLFARRKRKFKTTTDSNHNDPIASNILNRNFKVARVNQVRLSDITYIYSLHLGFRESKISLPKLTD